MKYFGTDGIRGETLKLFTPRMIKNIAKAVVIFYKKHKLKKEIIIGNDGRISSDYIMSNFASILLKYGIEIHNLGICSSPCLAYIGDKFNYPFAMMISASHNPSNNNGIKFFTNGEKISTCVENELEHLIDHPTRMPETSFAKLRNVENLKLEYIENLNKLKKIIYPCILDCSNGGVSNLVNLTFPKVKKINNKPNGENINLNCGCTCINVLQSECRKQNLVGFAFDGDGDRVIAVDTNGDVIDGDKILFILSKFFLSRNSVVVGTINSNSGLQQSLKKYQIEFIKTDVGDKNVAKSMTENNSQLGGESSGHIIIKPFTKTGDGVLTAIILMNILVTTKLTFNELLFDYIPYVQKLENLPLNATFIMNDNLKALVSKHEKEGARIVIRPSGTEPVLRVLIEHKNEEKCEKILKNLINFIKNT